MKFIIDEMPRFGYECPFFSLGWCHKSVARSDIGQHMCPIFNEQGHRRMDAIDNKCSCLTVKENNKWLD